MKVSVNRQRCVGQGMCVLYAPQAFALSDEDGCSETQFEDVPADQEDAVRRAVDACPEQAIVLFE